MAALFLVAACGPVAGTGTPAVPVSPRPTLPVASPPSSAAASPSSSAAATAAPTPSATAPTAYRHVYVIVMENKEYGSIVGSADAPFENRLIATYGLATSLYGEGHPSEPNYIALVSGGMQGVTTDGIYNLAQANVFDQIEAAGRTWHVYEQGYPGSCFAGASSGSVVDGPGVAGDYARKHNPAISFTAISGDPARCARITGLAGFDPAAADFEFIVPNENNDMHSASIATGDAFLAAFVPLITTSAAFADSILFITWDEGTTDAHGGGHIATIVAVPGMTAGSRFTATTSHASILAAIERSWGLPLLGDAAAAPAIVPGS